VNALLFRTEQKIFFGSFCYSSIVRAASSISLDEQVFNWPTSDWSKAITLYLKTPYSTHSKQ
jgi:hypothetical protein